jgi:hypothetical protein
MKMMPSAHELAMSEFITFPSDAIAPADVATGEAKTDADPKRQARIAAIRKILRAEQDSARMPGAKPYGTRRKVINLGAELDRLLRAASRT